MNVYEGNEKYIFISYSHKDSKKVVPVIKRLQKEGFLVWYDEGIEAGAEWPDTVARHLKGCELFIAFISKTFLDSFNCRRETDYAVSKRKPFIAVMLEDAEMPPGMEMQFSGVQFISKFMMNEKTFYEKLLRSELLDNCCNDAPPQEANEPKPKKRFPWVIAAVIAGVLIAGALVWFAGNRVTNVTIAGQQYDFDEEHVTIENCTLTEADTRRLSRFTNLRLLHFENCVFDGDSENNLANIKSGVRSFSVKGCTGIDSYAWINSLNNVEWLYINDCGFTDDDALMARLDSMKNLKGIDLSGNPDFTDIGLILDHVTSDISNIELNDTGVYNLSPLRDCANLQLLKIRGTKVESLEPLKDLQYILYLDISGSAVKDLEGLNSSYRLETLSAERCNIGSIEALGDCTTLERVDLAGNSITDVSPLAKSKLSLKYLFLDQNSISDMLPLAGMSNLSVLSIDNNEIEDLSFITGSPNLDVLSANHNLISSVEPITTFSKLSGAYLADNRIEGDICFEAPFGEDNESMTGEAGIRELDLQHNKITSIAFLGKPPFALAIHDNPLVSLTGSAVVEDTGEDNEPETAVFKTHGKTIIIDDFVEPTIREGTMKGASYVYMTWNGPEDTMLDIISSFDQYTSLDISGCPEDYMTQIREMITNVNRTTDEKMDETCSKARAERLKIYLWE